MDVKTLFQATKEFIKYASHVKYLSKTHDEIIRMPNFPEYISENIARFALQLYLNLPEPPSRDTKSGDLDLLSYKIEVKTFSSDGPISFGPSEKWDQLVLVDARDYMNNNYYIYLIEYSNDSLEFSSIMVNKSTSYLDMCKTGKRPRINPLKLIDQLIENMVAIEKIFSGSLTQFF